jgi:hypothetical protein
MRGSAWKAKRVQMAVVGLLLTKLKLLFFDPTLTSLSRYLQSSVTVLQLCLTIRIHNNRKMADTPSDPPPDYDKSTASQGTAQRPLRKGPLPLELPILKHLNSKRVILASASPRRKALLQQVCENCYLISVYVLTLFSLASQTLRFSHLPSLRISTRLCWDHSNT